MSRGPAICRIARAVRAAALLLVTGATAVLAGGNPILVSATQEADRLILFGENFGSSQGDSQTLLDGVPLSVVSWADDEVVVTLPGTTTPGFHSVAIDVDPGGIAQGGGLIYPSLDRVVPASASAGVEVVLRGWFFGDDPADEDAVLFGGSGGTPIEVDDADWSATEIRFPVPDHRAVDTEVALRAGGLSSIGDADFFLQHVVAEVVPSTARVGEVIRLRGSGFGDARASGDAVFVNGEAATIVSWSGDEVEVEVPFNACSGGQTFVRLEGGLAAIAPPFTLAAPTPIDEETVGFSGGTSLGNGDMAFPAGATLTVTFEADPGLAATVTLSGVPLGVDEAPLGTYTATYVVDPDAGGYPGDGDHSVTLSVTNGCQATMRSPSSTVILDTVPPVIDFVRRDNNPPPGQDDRYQPGDTVEILLRGTESAGSADFYLYADEISIFAGTGTRVGLDHHLALTLLAGVGGEWQIRAILRDVAGNITEIIDSDPDDLIRIAHDALPSVLRVLATPGGAARGDSLGVDATLTVRVGTTSSSASAAEALFVSEAGAVVARHDLPSVSPDGGVGEVRAFEATIAATDLVPGILRLDVVVCDSGSLPGACAAEDGCNCRRLADRVFRVDLTPPEVADLRLVPLPSAPLECDPPAVSDGDVFRVVVDATGGESGLRATADLDGTLIVLAETVRGTYVGTMAITADSPQGSRTVTVRLDDGVNLSAVTSRPMGVDHVPPAAAEVVTTVDAGPPITPGDHLSVTATAAEAGLIATVTLGDRLTDAPMTEVSPGVHEIEWTVPAESPGRAQELSVTVTLSDCAHAVVSTGSPVSLTTVTPTITDVSVEGECLSIADSVSVFVAGPPGMVAARAWLISVEGEPIGDAIPLTERQGRYEGRFELSVADSTRVRELQSMGLVTFRMLAELERSSTLVSEPATSEAFILVDRTAGPVIVTEVGEGGRPIGDRLVVPDLAFTLRGERGADEAVWMRFGAASFVVAEVDGTPTWSVDLDLGAFGVDPGDHGPFDVEIFGRACGADGPHQAYTLWVDRIPPSVSGVSVFAGETPVDTSQPVSAGTTLRVLAQASDDGPALVGEIHLWTGDPERGGAVEEVFPMAPVAGARGGTITFEGTIPGVRFDLAGVRFETWVTDGANVTVAGAAAPPVAVTSVRTDRAGSFFVPGDGGEGGLSSGQWHLLSVPAVLGTTSSVALFEAAELGEPSQATWRLLRWAPSGTGPAGEYQSSETDGSIPLLPGAAYWFQWRTPVPRAHAFDLGPGRSVPFVPSDLTLDEGWNLVATPFAVPTAWPEDAPTLRRWQPAFTSYSASDDGRNLLVPFTGYFVYATEGQSVTLDPMIRPSTEPSPHHPAGFDQVAGAWSLRIRLEAPHGVDALNYAAVHPHGMVGLDELDLGEVPVPDIGVTLTLMPEGAAGARLAADVRGPAPLHRWNLDARSAVAAPEAVLVVEGMDRIPEGLGAVLLEDRTGRATDLRAADRLTTSLLAGPGSRYTLLVGDPDLVAEAALAALPAVPGHLTLGVPFPNPFGSGTRIDLALPAPSDVTARVHDVNGREVRGIRLPALGAGAHTLVWDGRDDRGRSVPAGVYFLRVNGAGQTRLRKLVRIGEEGRR